MVDRLVTERLEREAEAVRAEGWRWIDVAANFPYGHIFGLRQVRGETVPLTEEEANTREALADEYDRLEAKHAHADLPEAVDQRLAEIEVALHAFEDRSALPDPADISRAGAFVSIDGEGRLRVERGFMRPVDELPIAAEPDAIAGLDSCKDGDPVGVEPAAVMIARTGSDGGTVYAGAAAEPEEDKGIKPLPDLLLTELTAHRTLALRDAVGEVPEVALLAALHSLCLKLFSWPSA